jgi:hypothetical protein
LLSGFVLKKLFNLWMQTVRDDTYRIGNKLHNLRSTAEEVVEEEQQQGSSSSGSHTTTTEDVAAH